MPKCLNLTFAGIAACLVVGCATQPKLTAVHRMPKVRTTAYTHTERGGGHNPLGTRFRIATTNEEYMIDDYGMALVGTDTIDLYKSSRLDMRHWGVRYVDIDILQWGSEERSLKVLAPRCKNHCVRQMVSALEKKRGKTVAQQTTLLRSL